MSVIVKDLSEETIYVMTKGAESSLEKSIVEDDSKLIAFHHVEEFASSGLRTLGNHYNRLDFKANIQLCDYVRAFVCLFEIRKCAL